MGHRMVWMAALVACFALVDCKPNTCADIRKFEGVKQNGAISGSRFFTLNNQTFVVCARQCLLRSVCQSYNFELATGICELNEKDSTALVPPGERIEIKPGVVTSDRNAINPAIADVCGHVSCPKNSACMVLDNGTWRCRVECPDPVVTKGTLKSEITHHIESVLTIDCDPGLLLSGTAKCQPNGTWTSLSCEQGCVNPPSVQDGELLSERSVWEVGTVLDYNCTGSKVQLGKAKCMSDFSWTEVKCITAVGSCSNLKKCNSTYTDGEYWLVSDSITTPVKIYCHGMSTDDPKEFLTLPEEENYVDYSDVTCPCISAWGSCARCVTTRFLRLRISDFRNLKTKHKDLRDYTFTNTTGHCRYIQYGSAFDCYAHTICNKEKTRDIAINTRGTGLKLDPNQRWSSQSSGSLLDPIIVEKTDSGRHITVKCHQRCSWCFPVDNTYSFIIDEDLLPDIVSASVPIC